MLFVVDQPATIGALPVAVARDEGVTVAYLPGLAMRRIADLHPGKAKTDARDAAVIADAARTMPHTLRSLQTDDEQIAELAVLAGFDDDLAEQITATINRIRGLLTHIHPALERVLGPGWTIRPCWTCSHDSPPRRRWTPLAGARRGRGCSRWPAPGGRWPRRSSPPWGADRRCHRHRGRRRSPAQAGRAAGDAASPTPRVAAQVEDLVRCAPSFPGPDLDARHRRQDRRQHPDRSRRQGLRRPPATSPPTPGSPRSPADPGPRSAASTRPAAATNA